MNFWEDLKLAMVGARNPLLANQIEKGKAKELELANNPAGKNIIIPYNAMRPRKIGLYDGNIVDDHLVKYYNVGYANPTHGTNEVYNPISGLSSGLYTRVEYDSEGNPYISTKHMSRHYDPSLTDAWSGFYHTKVKEDKLYELDNKQGVTVNTPTPEQLQNVTPSVESNTKQEQQATSRRDLYNQNQGGGISTQEAYRRQKALRDAGYNIVYDGYWGDASNQAWNEYQKKLQQPQTPQMPAQFSNVDIIGAIKTEEARKKAELEALMQQQGAGSELLNTDPHNIQGGYVVPKEEPLDYSKLQTHTTDTNPFGFITADPLRDASKFYLKGGEVKEKPKMISISGPNYNETMVEGTDSTGTNKYQFREIEQQGDTTKVLYMRDPKTGQIIAVPADSRFNKDFEWMVRNAEPVNEYKKGGSLKKCSCGCKTLLKRGKGGKVMESRNCK